MSVEKKDVEGVASDTQEQNKTTYNDTLSGLFKAQEEAQTKVDNAREAFTQLSQKGESARQKLFETIKPQIDAEKEARLRDFGKAQAITDFLTALTTGVIGTASKGFVPQQGDNAKQFAVDLSALRDVNKKQQEQYKQIMASTEYDAYEKDLQRAEKNLTKAENELKEAKQDVFSWKRFQEQQDRIDRRNTASNQKSIIVAGIRSAKKAGTSKESVMDFGGYKITVPKNHEINWYHYLVANGVPKRMVSKKDVNNLGITTITTEEKAPKSRAEFQEWLSANLDAALPYINDIESATVEENITPAQQQTTQSTINNSKIGW